VSEYTPELDAMALRVAQAVFRRLPPGFDLDDIAQEARLATWQACQSYDAAQGLPLASYAYFMARHACYMSVRRKAYKWAMADAIQDVYLVEATADQVRFADEERVERERLELAGRRLRNKTVIRRRHKLMMSYDALAKASGVGLIRAKRAVRRAEDLLRQQLEAIV